TSPPPRARPALQPLRAGSKSRSAISTGSGWSSARRCSRYWFPRSPAMGEARGCLSSAERGVEGLIAAVKAGDNHAGEALVTAMTPLVAGLARRFEGRVSRSDLE